MRTIINILSYWSAVLVISFFSAYTVALFRKLGVIEWMQVHGNTFIYNLFSCDFCLSWWMCVCYSLLGLCVSGNFLFVTIPFCATMLTRKLL